MRDQTIGSWLDDLASSAPAPGGGAVAALHVAAGAALIEMVTNLTIGKPKYAEHEDTMVAARNRAGELRTEAVTLAADDAAAFTAVTDSYKLPKDSPDRAAQIQAALIGAADVPVRTAAAATEVLDLAERILPGANVNVITDVAAAAASARAALDMSVVNIEINRGGIADETIRTDLSERLAAIPADIARADAVVSTVNERIRR